MLIQLVQRRVGRRVLVQLVQRRLHPHEFDAAAAAGAARAAGAAGATAFLVGLLVGCEPRRIDGHEELAHVCVQVGLGRVTTGAVPSAMPEHTHCALPIAARPPRLVHGALELLLRVPRRLDGGQSRRPEGRRLLGRRRPGEFAERDPWESLLQLLHLVVAEHGHER